MASDGMTLVFVPAGEFTMGSDGDAAGVFETPSHTVHVDGFWIDQSEVTNRQFAACVKDGACEPPFTSASASRMDYYGVAEFDSFPVIEVDWSAAAAYCKWAGRRLPTEAEWEKAARGTDGRTYPWGNEWDVESSPRLNFSDKNFPNNAGDAAADDGYADTAPVGNYVTGASPYGAVDMAGNVWEWVSDFYGAQYYGASPSSNPPGPDSGSGHVLRGGSFASDMNDLRTAKRVWLSDTSAGDDVGFRCARSQ
jgi:serine/threonine-protein kinase